MPSTITFFPVNNGDMTLIKLIDETTILIDVSLCQVNSQDDSNFTGSTELIDRLNKDQEGRPYVDAFLLSHPDQDHCRGLKNYFHLGPLDKYNFEPEEDEDLKIVINEIWSSAMVFRRASTNNVLCDDAKAFNTEARRRVKSFRENGFSAEGDRIVLIGEDQDGKTDDLGSILVKVDEIFNRINGSYNEHISMRVLGPLPVQTESEEEIKLQKNHSSIIIHFTFKTDGAEDACLFLAGGDAEAYIWEKIWNKKKDYPSHIQYDLLLAPHHCSWHTLSYDSWSKDQNPQVNRDSKLALAQARDGACIISSSKPIDNDDSDPPCWGAKKEYLSIIEPLDGKFYCTQEYPNREYPEPLVFKISKEGPQPPSKKSVPILGAAVGSASTREPRHHG